MGKKLFCIRETHLFRGKKAVVSTHFLVDENDPSSRTGQPDCVIGRLWQGRLELKDRSFWLNSWVMSPAGGREFWTDEPLVVHAIVTTVRSTADDDF